jgi:hypothetical protein
MQYFVRTIEKHKKSGGAFSSGTSRKRKEADGFSGRQGDCERN